MLPVGASEKSVSGTEEGLDCSAAGVEDLATGETHLDRHGNKWSANFQGWVQYRQVLGENYVA